MKYRRYKKTMQGDATGLAIKTALPKLKAPTKYKVVLMNDDYTPMDFVVDIIQRFFYLDQLHATEVMLQVHQQGKGVCGVFTREVAESKVHKVNSYARGKQHPLLCRMEAE